MKQRLGAQPPEEFSPTSRVGRWVDHILGPNFPKYGAGGEWTPAVNVYEQADSYALVVDLAGVRVEDVDLELTGRVLTVRGKRLLPLLPGTEGQVAFHLMEIDHGRFRRRFELPGEVDADRVEACYRQGFLLVRIPKK